MNPGATPADCFHCGTPVPPDLHIEAAVAGVPRPMCCHGCAAVAEAIEAAGLTDFYRQRAAAGALPAGPPLPPGLDLTVYDDPRLWPGFVHGGDGRTAEVSLLLEGVSCQACVWLNERRLTRLPGVHSVQANYATRRLRVAFDPVSLPLSRILATVAELGYRATPFDEQRALGALAGERRASLIRVGLAGLFSSQVMMLAFALYTQGELDPGTADFFNAVSALLALPVVTWCAFPFYAGALRDLRTGRLGMDVPVALGVLAAFVGSLHAALAGGAVWWDSATMFVFLLLTGRHLELLARSGAESASLELARMTPAVAHRLRVGAVAEGAAGAVGLAATVRTFPADDPAPESPRTADADETRGTVTPEDAVPRPLPTADASTLATVLTIPEPLPTADADASTLATALDDARFEFEEDVPVAVLSVGDRLRVRPGETIPVDGTVLAGRSSVEQSLLTGESIPIVRGPGDPVIGGTQNLEGPLEIRVDAIGESTLLAGLGRLLERAQGGKSRVTELADRYAGWFVAGVLLLAGGVFLHGLMTGSDSALARTIAVLVATCPCALSLATPVTVVAATTRWFRLGLLATRPHAVEALGRATHFVFDKTGTLTEGRPTLAATHLHGSLDAPAALALAAALAQCSEHPLSRALLAAAGPAASVRVDDLESIPGGGLSGTLAGRRMALGSPAFVRDTLGIQPPADPCESGDTPVLLADAQGPIATFALRDRLRPGALELIRGLRAQGCRVSLLTGDAESPAHAVARRLDIDLHEVGAGLSPAGKLVRVQGYTAGGATVAMLGDGVNDAPVLAAATVSVAMGQGTALARSAADAIFLGSDLRRLLEARDTGRRAIVIIRENLAWALAWNVGVLPAAAGGWLSAWLAALGMSGSSLLVILNALRVAGSGARDRAAASNAAPVASVRPDAGVGAGDQHPNRRAA